jgi:hypothetical protein
LIKLDKVRMKEVRTTLYLGSSTFFVSRRRNTMTVECSVPPLYYRSAVRLPYGNALTDCDCWYTALEAREGRISGAARAGLASLADDSIAWTPKRDPEVGPRPESTVNSLFQGCLELLVEHIEDVETLWGMPDLIKVGFHAAF